MTHPQGPDPCGTESAGPPAPEEQTAQVQIPALPNTPTASPPATSAQPWWPAPATETPPPAEQEPTPVQDTAGAWPWAPSVAEPSSPPPMAANRAATSTWTTAPPSGSPSQPDGAAAEPAPQHTAPPYYGHPDQYHQGGYPPAPANPSGQPGVFNGGAQAGYSTGITPLPAKASRGSARTIGAVAAAVLVLGALVGVLGFWKPGYFRSVQLSVSAAQTGVQQVLTDATTGYGIANVRDVTCNGGTNPVVKKNAKFECEVTIDGAKRRVTATFSDDNGSYQIGQPK